MLSVVTKFDDKFFGYTQLFGIVSRNYTVPQQAFFFFRADSFGVHVYAI